MKEKIGIVDVGGGLRGVYAAGIFDYCMDNGITFDLGIGVSAGSANLASFIAGQPRRNLVYYTEYAMRKQYMGIGNFLRIGSFIDLDYVYGTLSNSDGEYPLDYAAMVRNPMEFLVVSTEAETGHATYFTKNDMAQDDYDIFKASSAIPAVCKPYEINGIPYYDGALSDTIPIQKAFEQGCDRVVLVLTLPEDTVRNADRDRRLASRIRKTYPSAAEKLTQRAAQYNDGVTLARTYRDEGKLLILAPDDSCGVSTLSRNKENLLRLYEKGYRDGSKLHMFLSGQNR